MLVMAQCDLFITRNGKHDLNCIKACNFNASEVHAMVQHACVAHKNKDHIGRRIENR